MSQIEGDARLRAFQNRINPTPHTTSALLTILQTLDWNVDRSESFFRRWQANQRTRHHLVELVDDEVDEEAANHEPNNDDCFGPTYPNGLTIQERLEEMDLDHAETPVMDSMPKLAYTGNADYERRQAVQVLADMVLTQHGILLSRSEAALALGFASWDVERAVESYRDDRLIRALLSERFDPTRVDPIYLRSNIEVQSERDRRLALLLTYTGFGSWYSARLHLTSYSDDLVKAIAAWVRGGIEPVRHMQDKAGRPKEGEGRRRNFDGEPVPLPVAEACNKPLTGDSDRSWAEEPDLFMDEKTRKKMDLSAWQRTSTGSWSFPTFGTSKKAVTVDGKKTSRIPGGVINYDPEPPRANAPDWTKLRFEYFQKGKYKTVPFKNNTTYRAPDLGENRSPAPPGDNRQLFDWSDTKHVQFLRKWAAQKLTRTTGQVLREPGQRLSIEEKRYLHDLLVEAFTRYSRYNPDKSEKELKKNFTVPHVLKKDWARRWNAKFAGKTVPSKKEPRRQRLPANLYGLIKRWPKLCSEYGMTFDTTGTITDANIDDWPWDLPASGNASNEEQMSESDVDLEDEDDEEYEDE